MKLFGYLYDQTLKWAQHAKAPYFLAGLSFTEAAFFPIPPDVMLVPMALTQPRRAWFFAGLTTFFSVLGSLLGYAIGHLFYVTLHNMIAHMGYMATYLKVQHWFSIWGVWVMVVAGFTPIPYKLFTIIAGMLAMPLGAFVVAAVIGRSLRFFLVAGVLSVASEPIQRWLLHYIEWVGWGLVTLSVLAFSLYIYIH